MSYSDRGNCLCEFVIGTIFKSLASVYLSVFWVVVVVVVVVV